MDDLLLDPEYPFLWHRIITIILKIDLINIFIIAH